MEKLIKKLKEVQEILKDFNMFKHLFSKDDGIKTLAKLNETIGQILLQIKFAKIKKVGHPENKALINFYKETGLVQIRPCGKEYKNKTYIGFYIGDIALGSSISIKDEKIICSWVGHNPAIYIPELKKVIYGCESWWGSIDSVEELNNISNKDINNVWYIKLLKDILKNNENSNKEKKL